MAVVPVVRPDVAPYSAHEAPDRTIRIASGVVTHDLHLGDKIIVDGDAPIVANGMSRQALYALAAHMDERYWGRVAEWFDAVPFAPPVLVAVIDHDTADRDSPTSPIAALFVRQADPARHVPRSAALVLLDRLAVDTRVGAMRGRILGEERRQFGHLPGYVPTQFAGLEPTSILMLSEDPLFRSVTIPDGQGRDAFSDVVLRLLDEGSIELL